MNPLERDLRELFVRREIDAPLVDLGEPEHIARRTRRRQVVVAGTTAVLSLALLAGTAVGVGALVRADRSRPAQPAPPDETPVVIERGTHAGWDWVLSASEDGTCVALTDEQGSTTICPTDAEAAALPDFPDLPSTDIVGITVRSPRPPGPNAVFVFGIVSPRVGSVDVSLRTFDVAEDLATYLAPEGIDGGRGFFLGRFDGYPYPVVPEIRVWAMRGSGPEIDFALVERPSWAEPPYELVEAVASGTQDRPEILGAPIEWTLGVWLNRLEGGDLCYPESYRRCGPHEDPVPAWNAGGWLEIVERQGSWTNAGNGTTFFWGLFREPVVSVRVELRDRAPFEADLYPPPSDYPDAPRVFTFEYEGKERDLRGRVVGLDADGNVVATARLP